jgi:putative ABC transport system permease protein
LFGEFALEIGVGVPLGLAISQGIISLIAHFHSSESFQIPGVIGARTYAVAALIVIASALASAYVVRRRIDRLDLVSVLKTRD